MIGKTRQTTLPTEEAARKLIYLAIINAKRAGNRPTTGAQHCLHSKSTSGDRLP
jgi:hypothetical protein